MLRLTTTNDNLDALRFYQRRGFRLQALRPGAVDAARAYKPTISAVGEHGIPIRDELDLTLQLRAPSGPLRVESGAWHRDPDVLSTVPMNLDCSNNIRDIGCCIGLARENSTVDRHGMTDHEARRRAASHTTAAAISSGSPKRPSVAVAQVRLLCALPCLAIRSRRPRAESLAAKRRYLPAAARAQADSEDPRAARATGRRVPRPDAPDRPGPPRAPYGSCYNTAADGQPGARSPQRRRIAGRRTGSARSRGAKAR